MDSKQVWDVAVIGGGAAGMMAAGQAAAAGARTVLIEKNAQLGKKLLITGGGRCNVTNAEPDQRIFLKAFNSRGRAADQFLFSPFSRHGVADSIAFFNGLGVETKVEARNRVFPVSDSAQSVWDALYAFMEQHGVQTISGVPVIRIVRQKDRIDYVELQNGQRIRARSFILATGGLSRPETGSTGDGFSWLRELGHAVATPDPSLVPLTLKDSWSKAIAGVSLHDIELSILEDGKKISKKRGGILFTHQGISGPTALNLSKDVGDRLPYGPVVLSLDLMPNNTLEQIDESLRTAIATESNRKISNVLVSIIPSSLISHILESTGVSGDIAANSVTREQRIALGTILKNVQLHVKGRLGFEKAIIASGGIELTDMDTKTMRSRIIENLYIIGDLLNIDRPSGGYSLQLCWTTAAVAAQAAAHSVVG